MATSFKTNKNTNTTAVSLTVNGTSGGGFLHLSGQSAAPATILGGSTLYSDGAGNLSWKRAGFRNTLDSSGQTSDRTWTLPDASGAIALNDNASTLTNKTATVAGGNNLAATTIQTVAVSGTPPMVGQSLRATSATTAEWQSAALATSATTVNSVAAWDSTDGTILKNTQASVVGGVLSAPVYNIPPTTSPTQGVITLGGSPFISAPGGTNLFVGNGAGNFTLTGANNFSCGNSSGQSITTGSGSVFIGQNTGKSITTGSTCVFIGENAGASNVSGYANVFVGEFAGNSALGVQNVCVGAASGGVLVNGLSNVFVGDGAGGDLTTSITSTCLGAQAGTRMTSSTNDIYIGTYAGSNILGVTSNNIIVGSYGSLGDTNTIRIGTAQTSAYIAGVATATPTVDKVVYVAADGKMSAENPPTLAFGHSDFGDGTTPVTCAATATWTAMNNVNFPAAYAFENNNGAFLSGKTDDGGVPGRVRWLGPATTLTIYYGAAYQISSTQGGLAMYGISIMKNGSVVTSSVSRGWPSSVFQAVHTNSRIKVVTNVATNDFFELGIQNSNGAGGNMIVFHSFIHVQDTGTKKV